MLFALGVSLALNVALLAAVAVINHRLSALEALQRQDCAMLRGLARDATLRRLA